MIHVENFIGARRWRAALTAAFIAAGAHAQPIVVAQIAPFSGLAATDGKDLNAGILAHFAEVNKAGGIGGRKLALAEADDKYNGDEFERQLEAVMAQRPVAVLSPVGISTMRKVVGGLLDKHDTVVINAIPGTTLFRAPGHPRLFHVRASDRQQSEKALRQALALGMTSMQVVTQGIAGGSGDVVNAHKGLPNADKFKLTLTEVLPKPGALAAAAPELAKSGAQSYYVVGAPAYMAEAVAELRKAGVSKPIFALSYLPASLLVKQAGPDGARNVSIMQTFPNPMGQTLPLHKQFQTAMRASAPELKEYSAFNLEGYLTARVLTEALKRTSGAISPAALAVSLKRMGDINLGGFHVDFSNSLEGSRFVDIGIVSGSGRLVY